jgi:hypothetical protein
MTKELTTQLTPFEAVKLLELERKITEGFLEMAKALTEIRDKKLYRQNYKNYDDYCQKRWGRSSRWAEQLINSASVVQQLPSKYEPMVRNERTARELGCVPEELRVGVLEHINNSHKPVNSSTVKAAAIVLSPPRTVPKEEVECDELGWPIPPDAMPVWRRRQEVQDMLTQLSRIKGILEKAKGENDALYMSELHWDTAWGAVNALYSQLSHAKPYAVCLWCSGRVNTIKCVECDGRGMLSEKFWTRCKHEDMPKLKALRMSAIAKLKEKSK